jgi:hypothetical protein
LLFGLSKKAKKEGVEFSTTAFFWLKGIGNISPRINRIEKDQQAYLVVVAKRVLKCFGVRVVLKRVSAPLAQRKVYMEFNPKNPINPRLKGF